MNKFEPLVSICIVTYNHAKYIEQCLNSILSQKTNFSFEIILGEDESSDNTRTICIDYAKRYPEKIKLFLRSRKDVIYINGNATGRYNFLENLKACRGKYIALCEGDDYWTDPLKLQKQVDFLEANPDYAIHSGNACYLNYKEGEKIYDDNESHTFDINDFITKNNLITLTVMFRKPNSLDINMLKNIVYGDWGLYVLILKENGYKALRSSEVFGVYRKHNGSLTKKMNAIDQMENMIAQILFNVRYLNYDKFEVFKKSMGELSLFKTSFSNKLKLLVFQMAFQLIINRLKAYIRI